MSKATPRFVWSVIAALFAAGILAPLSAQAQFRRGVDTNDVRLFRSWTQDVVLTDSNRVEPFLFYGGGDFVDDLSLGLRASWRLSDEIEGGGSLAFVDRQFPGAADGSGLDDLGLYVRYLLDEANPSFSIGGSLELPVGDEDVGGSTVDFEAFGALRYVLESGVVLLGNAGLVSTEFASDRQNGLGLGGGVIIPTDSQLALLGEFRAQTNGDVFDVTGGLDYTLPSGAHVRGGLGLGLDDGSFDVMVFAAFAAQIYR